ncbi:MAG: hypothetical protein JO033_18540 [Acidobacteriaceae bacterium]|nr:hypothetical protein [Acidobacteriaceae bacterium]
MRLKPGVTPDQAQAEISAVAKRLESDYPATNRGRGIRLYPLWRAPFNNARTLLPTLSIALGVAVVLLLIVCANVSNLLLVKAFGRRHEIALRLAVGAGRGRLLRQLVRRVWSCRASLPPRAWSLLTGAVTCSCSYSQGGVARRCFYPAQWIGVCWC